MAGGRRVEGRRPAALVARLPYRRIRIEKYGKGCVEEKNATDNVQHESNYRFLGPSLPMFATGAAFSSAEPESASVLSYW